MHLYPCERGETDGGPRRGTAPSTEDVVGIEGPERGRGSGVDRGATPRGLSRRGVLALGAGAAAGLALAGCGARSDPSAVGKLAAGGGAGYSGPRFTLGFWNGFTGGDGPLMQELVELFNSDHES